MSISRNCEPGGRVELRKKLQTAQKLVRSGSFRGLRKRIGWCSCEGHQNHYGSRKGLAGVVVKGTRITMVVDYSLLYSQGRIEQKSFGLKKILDSGYPFFIILNAVFLTLSSKLDGHYS